jgi:uncharacterized membrane protein YgdD (TMEM256/DUF423 family)
VSSSAKAFLTLGALLAAAAVVLGAFGAHALKGRLAADAMAVYRTAVEYHFYHALGLVLIGSTALRVPDSAVLAASGWAMCAGIALFSGSLYVLAISGVRWIGAVTPLGGLAFIAAWLLFAWSVLRN